MNSKVSTSLILYGVIAQIIGAVGYATNPEKAMSALIVGTAACVLSVTWALFARTGDKWPIVAGIITTSIFLAASGFRAGIGWGAYAAGNPDKLMAASLTSAMALVSLFLLARLISALRAK